MVPVENAAGRAALVLHNKAEGTPDKHADKVTHVKYNRYKQQGDARDNTKKIKYTYKRNKTQPNYHHLVSLTGGRGNVIRKCLVADLLTDGAKMRSKELLRADRYIKLTSDGDKLKYHIYHPHSPQ